MILSSPTSKTKLKNRLKILFSWKQSIQPSFHVSQEISYRKFCQNIVHVFGNYFFFVKSVCRVVWGSWGPSKAIYEQGRSKVKSTTLSTYLIYMLSFGVCNIWYWLFLFWNGRAQYPQCWKISLNKEKSLL